MLVKTCKIALKAIFSNKMRSFLTMLGIIIGVTSVVVLVSLGQGTADSVTSQISGMGSTLLTANITDENLGLTREEIESLSENAAIQTVAPVVSTTATVRSGSATHSTNVVGVTPTYLEVMGLSVESGRMIAESDARWRTNVVVLGTDVAEEIFETWDVIGKELTIGDKTFTVVGLLAEQGTSSFGSADDCVLMPFTTAQRFTGETEVRTFYAAAASVDMVTRAENVLDAFLLQATRDEDAYTVYNQSEVLEAMESVQGSLSLMLGGIAAISLLVGGIGIMNIMLVSVAERTREIGIRKAIGARRGNILAQFLIEACVLSLMGGVIGIVLSFVGVEILGAFSSYTIQISGGIAVAALGFCVLIGVVFGGYPAAKASRLTPIEALRYS